MGTFIGDDMIEWDAQDSSAREEKIIVSVRLRPLNERELTRNDFPAWECINNSTILYKNAQNERSLLPIAYTFDRVFNTNCPTRQVYDEAAKKIALSVLNGMNSTIFAYGQTSSGKTYTMSGITEYTMADIYDYIDKHPERFFVLKFSAMEIYNESVKDLLCLDSGPLRLLDDPEKGTVVDKLTEVILRDSDHLNELLSICEAQRQTGETALNEVSSRSHQILRLTVESEAREFVGAENMSTLTATVNFVDLAGSERASQTSAAGTRLKEGCHINRSLLTLGTVIRKLSKGRNGHVPYRDSKLTRILQNSLGGNARTGIICTMSPAQSLVEQSRNTLHFASCAKQVSTNAQVNVVVSEKALVKQLQKELARLENELRGLTSRSASCGPASALKEKEELIEKMDKEIKELTLQRDMAHSRLESLLRSGTTSQASQSSGYTSSHEKGSSADEYSASEASETVGPNRHNFGLETCHTRNKSEDPITSKIEDQFPECVEEQLLSSETSPTQFIDKYFGPDPLKGWEKIAQASDNTEDSCKEVRCVEIDLLKIDKGSSSPSLETRHHSSGSSPCVVLENDASDPRTSMTRSTSCAAIISTTTDSLNSEIPEEIESKVDNTEGEAESINVEVLANSDNACTEDSENATTNEEEQKAVVLSEEYPEKQQETCVKDVSEVIDPTPVGKLEDNMEIAEKATDNLQETADDGSNETHDKKESVPDWRIEFERQMKEIIQLWDACHTPLAHRTYFFLLFKGDPSDAVYLEVELRRLSFLKNPINGAGVTKDDPSLSQASRAKALNREREMLSRKMLRKLSSKEREALYIKWGIDIKSKQRRLQLCRKLWTDTADMEHINESATVVAKLVGFKGPGQAPKEMFGLSFSPKPAHMRPFSWTHSLPSMI
ncbi:kinesin-like protein KIN-7H [Andrographis paniculata]|uniref:kinesin-like protein KIN-7H n=1 Tax=Andrographis paniculata TaxID=175694 RepID=UPI0021E92F1C|nr:kinesin-like protein KIN-7H [Andrographis paniculata]